jgi:hypothetical protein
LAAGPSPLAEGREFLGLEGHPGHRPALNVTIGAERHHRR